MAIDRIGRLMCLPMLALVTHCEGEPSGPTISSESHFLIACDSEAPCGSGLECSCGVCSSACKGPAACADFGESASCETSEALAASGACESGPALQRQCHSPCISDESCAAIAPELMCSNGLCLPFEPEDAPIHIPAACPDADIDFTLTLLDSLSVPGEEIPVEGAEICVEEPHCMPEPICASSNQNGVLRMKGVRGVESASFSLHAPGYYNWRADAAPLVRARSNTLRLHSTEVVDAAFPTIFGVSRDPSGGLASVAVQNAAGQASAGHQLALTPTVGEGPFYVGEMGLADASLTETTANGEAYWANLPPGDYVLSTGSSDCEVLMGLPSEDGAALVRVEAGTVTLVVITCAE